MENINKLGGARRPGPRCPWCVRDIHNPGPGPWQILIIGAFSILYTVGHHTSCTVATILQLWAGWMPGLLLICVSLNCLRHQANETSYSLLIRISAAVWRLRRVGWQQHRLHEDLCDILTGNGALSLGADIVDADYCESSTMAFRKR